MRVTREKVMDFVVSHGFSPFTTTDISTALDCKEYAVRGVVAWLLIGEYVSIVDWHPSRKHVKLYKWTGKTPVIVSYRRNAEERKCQMAAERSDAHGNAVQQLLNSFRLREKA
jgi:hypothetical protein